jgi:hypothetical protein
MVILHYESSQVIYDDKALKILNANEGLRNLLNTFVLWLQKGVRGQS